MTTPARFPAGPPGLRRLAQRKRWNRRCRAWDLHRRHLWVREQEEGRERAGRLAGKVGEELLARAGAAALETPPERINPRDVASWVEAGRNAAAHGWGDPSLAPVSDGADQDDPLGLSALGHADELTPAERAEIRVRAIDRLAGHVGRMAVDQSRPNAERLRAAQMAVQALTRVTDTGDTREDSHSDALDLMADVANTLDAYPEAKARILSLISGDDTGDDSSGGESRGIE